MKKLFSIIFAVLLLSTMICVPVISALSYQNKSPSISIEIADYTSSQEIIERSGTAKYCAAAGDKIAVTFILEGLDKLECYQLSGSFDTDMLLAGYYSNSEWVTGDEDQDFNTIIAGSQQYTNGVFDDSFSYTRTVENPMVCLVGFSLDGQATISERTTLISVGFNVLQDIDNIYDMFSWDDSTMVAVDIDHEEYYINDGLTFNNIHSYECEVVPPTCSEVGYTCYTCTVCGYEYKTSFVDPTGLHSYVIKNVDANGYHYNCDNCNAKAVISSDDLIAMWSVDYINKPPSVNNNSCYLDIHKDNIINAKDYAELCAYDFYN